MFQSSDRSRDHYTKYDTFSKKLICFQIIPKGTDLFLNMASVLHDETVFEDPLTFKPQRYLEGDIALKKHHTIPFSIGKFTSLISTSICTLQG